MNFKGYKVCNYDLWVSLPDIFTNLKEAKEAKSKWKYGQKATIEYFNSRNNKAKKITEKVYK